MMYTASNNSVTLYMTIQSVQTDNHGLQANTQYYDQTLILTSLVTYVCINYIESSHMKMYCINNRSNKLLTTDIVWKLIESY